jgi:hypothetical protein
MQVFGCRLWSLRAGWGPSSHKLRVPRASGTRSMQDGQRRRVRRAERRTCMLRAPAGDAPRERASVFSVQRDPQRAGIHRRRAVVTARLGRRTQPSVANQAAPPHRAVELVGVPGLAATQSPPCASTPQDNDRDNDNNNNNSISNSHRAYCSTSHPSLVGF